jgi:hypothetical protein
MFVTCKTIRLGGFLVEYPCLVFLLLWNLLADVDDSIRRPIIIDA